MQRLGAIVACLLLFLSVVAEAKGGSAGGFSSGGGGRAGGFSSGGGGRAGTYGGSSGGRAGSYSAPAPRPSAPSTPPSYATPSRPPTSNFSTERAPDTRVYVTPAPSSGGGMTDSPWFWFWMWLFSSRSSNPAGPAVVPQAGTSSPVQSAPTVVPPQMSSNSPASNARTPEPVDWVFWGSVIAMMLLLGCCAWLYVLKTRLDKPARLS